MNRFYPNLSLFFFFLQIFIGTSLWIIGNFQWGNLPSLIVVCGTLGSCREQGWDVTDSDIWQILRTYVISAIIIFLYLISWLCQLFTVYICNKHVCISLILKKRLLNRLKHCSKVICGHFHWLICFCGFFIHPFI